MKPYYQDNLVTLYHGNAAELLDQVADGLVVSDPPYNRDYHYDNFKDCMEDGDYLRLMASMFSCPRGSVIIHYPESVVKIAMAIGKAPERIVSWVYPSNTPRQHRSVAWFNCKPDFKRDGQDYKNPTDKRVAAMIAAGRRAKLYDWWQINQVKNVSKEKTAHPCQIPEQLMRRIIRITPCEVVTDPFAGAGTTLVAAKAEGKPSIGIEMSERYCEIIAKRLQNYI